VRIGINAMVLGPRDAGVGQWTRGLIRALARVDRHNEYVVYHREEAGTPAPGAGENFRFVVAPVPAGSRLARIAWEQLALPARLRHDRVDVLHCPAYVMPRAARVPTVVTLHDLFALTHPRLCTRLNVLHYRLMLPAAVRGAALLHCTSHWTRAVLCTRFPSAVSRARVVHPAVDDIFRPLDPGELERFRRERGLAQPPFLFVGGSEPKKNVPALLAALAVLGRRYGSERKLLMVGGSGWRAAETEAMIANLGLAGRVLRWGYVRRGELPLIYGCALALVFPSVVEGFGLPPLEAMACGTPVVTTGAGGLAESVGASALLVRDPQPDALARAMHRLETSETLRARLVQAGLRRAGSFRWDAAAKQLLALYRECLSAARGRDGGRF